MVVEADASLQARFDAAAAVAGRSAVLWLVDRRRSFGAVGRGEGRSIVGGLEGRRGRRRRDCSLNRGRAGIGVAGSRSLVCSLGRKRGVGRLAYCCRASGGRFGIGVSLVGWRRGCTWTAVGYRRMFEVQEVEGDGHWVIGGWASWSAVWEMDSRSYAP